MTPEFQQLLNACKNGDISTVQKFMQQSDVAWFESEALRTAASHNHTDIVLLLLPHSSAAAVDSSALKSAIYHNNTTLINALMPVGDRGCFFSLFADRAPLASDEEFDGFEEIPQEKWDHALKQSIITDNLKHIDKLITKASEVGIYNALEHLGQSQTFFNNRQNVIDAFSKVQLSPENSWKFAETLCSFPIGNNNVDLAISILKNITVDVGVYKKLDLLKHAFNIMNSDLINVIVGSIDKKDIFSKYGCLNFVLEYAAEKSTTSTAEHFMNLGFSLSEEAVLSISKNHKQLCRKIPLEEMSALALENMCGNEWHEEAFDILKNCINAYYKNNDCCYSIFQDLKHHLSFNFNNNIDMAQYLLDDFCGDYEDQPSAPWIAELFVEQHKDRPHLFSGCSNVIFYQMIRTIFSRMSGNSDQEKYYSAFKDISERISFKKDSVNHFLEYDFYIENGQLTNYGSLVMDVLYDYVDPSNLYGGSFKIYELKKAQKCKQEMLTEIKDKGTSHRLKKI